MPSEDTDILELHQDQKFDKAPFIIYADVEYIIEKTDGCKNNPENSCTKKVREHIPSGFSMSIIYSFGSIENNHDIYRGKDSIKKVCELLREHAIRLINFKKKKWFYSQKSSRNHMKMQKPVRFIKNITLWS